MFNFSESDDFISFERRGADVIVMCSYVDEAAMVHYKELMSAVDAFIESRLSWIKSSSHMVCLASFL